MEAARNPPGGDPVACLHRIGAGDRDALGALYDRYTPLLLSLARRVVGNAADAEDVLQQSWVQVWHSAARYEPARGPVAGWLCNIVRSRALDRVRSRSSRERVEGGAGGGGSASDPAASLVERERHSRVRAALGAIDASERRVLELAYFEGLAQSEIAERLKAPLGTVKTWTRRGLSRLRDLLQGEATP